MSGRQLVVILAFVAWLTAGCGNADAPDPVPARPVPDARTKSVDELIATINDDPVELHFNYTPSGDALIERGPAVIPHVLDLMLSPGTASRDQEVMTLSVDDETRMRAQRVLEAITAKEFGCLEVGGWQRADYDRWQTFWVSLGDLKWDAPLEQRRQCVQKWREWFASRKSI